MKHYKIGFLGAGNVFSKHYNSIKKIRNFSIGGIYDKKFSKLRDKIYLSDEKSIFKNQKIDIISVLTPSGEHFNQTKKILSSKKACNC